MSWWCPVWKSRLASFYVLSVSLDVFLDLFLFVGLGMLLSCYLLVCVEMFFYCVLCAWFWHTSTLCCACCMLYLDKLLSCVLSVSLDVSFCVKVWRKYFLATCRWFLISARADVTEDFCGLQGSLKRKCRWHTSCADARQSQSCANGNSSGCLMGKIGATKSVRRAWEWV